MPNTTISPNMNLPIPVPGVDPGPDWANNIVSDMNIIDSHNHSAGQGVQITPDGININDDLAFNGNNATTLVSSQYTSQSGSLPGTVLNAVYVDSGDLWYNNGGGTPVQVTNGNVPAGGAGSIAGLPSGTASASFAGSVFSFKSATNTPAKISAGSYVFGQQVASGYGVTVAASGSQASNYNLTWPATAPGIHQSLTSDGSGNFSWTLNLIPIGTVFATFPSLTGAYVCPGTTTADANGYVRCEGQTIADGTSPMNGAVIPNLNNNVFIRGNTTDGSSGGADTSTAVIAHTHTFTSDTRSAVYTHTHNMAHYHQWSYTDSGPHIYGLNSGSISANLFTTSGSTGVLSVTAQFAATAAANAFNQAASTSQFFTTGSLGQPNGSLATASTSTANEASTLISGTTDSTGSGSSFSIVPTYITAVYLMKIKNDV